MMISDSPSKIVLNIVNKYCYKNTTVEFNELLLTGNAQMYLGILEAEKGQKVAIFRANLVALRVKKFFFCL